VKLFVDSSAFAKWYIEEPSGEQLEEALQKASELALCIILLPEILSALNRRRREGIFCPQSSVLCPLSPSAARNSRRV
jgi:predicted nucleic acid-binding protein